jgi:hypothetical protein
MRITKFALTVNKACGQENVKVRLNPVKKIPLNPPLIKGDLIFPSFEKLTLSHT